MNDTESMRGLTRCTHRNMWNLFCILYGFALKLGISEILFTVDNHINDINPDRMKWCEPLRTEKYQKILNGIIKDTQFVKDEYENIVSAPDPNRIFKDNEVMKRVNTERNNLRAFENCGIGL